MKFFALFAVCALGLFAAGENSNRRAPGFSLMDSKFQQHDLQDYRGRVVVLDFMQTGCPECNELADTLIALKAKYGEKIAIISIVTLPDNFGEVDKFAERHKTTWPIVFDSGQVMMSYLQIKPTGNMNVKFPHIFVIDGAGKIRDDFDGTATALTKLQALSLEVDQALK